MPRLNGGCGQRALCLESKIAHGRTSSIAPERRAMSRDRLDLDHLPRRLRRNLAAEYLRLKHGLELSPLTLAAYACRGGGPAYRKYNRIPYYAPRDLDAWARKRLSRRVTQNTELREASAS